MVTRTASPLLTRDARFALRHAAIAAGVVLIHVAFLAAFLVYQAGPAPPASPLAPGRLTIIRSPRPPPPPPIATFAAFAAPAAPFIPPPEIHIRASALRVVATRDKKAVLLDGFSKSPGVGSAVRSGQIKPPSPPVFIGSGSPAYPRPYRDFRLNGFVSIVCTIEITGNADHCRLVNVEGGPAFGQAALSWLQNGEARYQPATRDGQKVAQRAALKFVFVPE